MGLQIGFSKQEGGNMLHPYRDSSYIDFNTGIVNLAPMDMKASKPSMMTTDDKIDLFECRVEVWQLGVAAAILKQIEDPQNSSMSIWSHAAYGLVSVIFSYFEMIGKTLNPNSASNRTAGDDFNFGFCNVYPKFTPANRIYKDTINKGKNCDILAVVEFRDRIRNGMYHLGYTKKGLWLHNDPGDDFQVVREQGPSGAGMVNVYHMNPHATTRTIINHFPMFTADLRNAAKGLQTKFLDFYDKYHLA